MAFDVHEFDERPGVWRLDHPDWQDVHRTSYKKGIITDFKKVSDDPLRVESMVKVQIEEMEESDYIPIFYKPKEKYWDDEDNDVLATDFDEDNKLYKQAWMSFRGEDEVVVACQATANNKRLVPKYAIGFIDNYPRIGENIIEYSTEYADTAQEYYFYWDCIEDKIYDDDGSSEPYNEEQHGKDGLDLKLLTESNIIHYSTGNRPATSWVIRSLDPTHPFFSMGDWKYYYSCIPVYQCTSFTRDAIVARTAETPVDFLALSACVGPFIYVIYLLGLRSVSTAYPTFTDTWQLLRGPIEFAIGTKTGCGHIAYLQWPSICDGTVHGYSSIYGGMNDLPYDDIELLGYDIVDATYGGPGVTSNRNYTSILSVYYGLYSKELYKKIEDHAKSVDALDAYNKYIVSSLDSYWLGPPSELVEDTEFTDKLNYPDFDGSLIWPIIYQNHLKSKMYVRPHTKQELIDTGLLNEDGTLPEE